VVTLLSLPRYEHHKVFKQIRITEFTFKIILKTYELAITLQLNTFKCILLYFTLLYFIEFIACTKLIAKRKERRKEKMTFSNWSGKQDDVPIDIQPQ